MDSRASLSKLKKTEMKPSVKINSEVVRVLGYPFIQSQEVVSWEYIQAILDYLDEEASK